jgi:hypothetical protein
MLICEICDILPRELVQLMAQLMMSEFKIAVKHNHTYISYANTLYILTAKSIETKTFNSDIIELMQIDCYVYVRADVIGRYNGSVYENGHIIPPNQSKMLTRSITQDGVSTTYTIFNIYAIGFVQYAYANGNIYAITKYVNPTINLITPYIKCGTYFIDQALSFDTYFSVIVLINARLTVNLYINTNMTQTYDLLNLIYEH